MIFWQPVQDAVSQTRAMKCDGRWHSIIPRNTLAYYTISYFLFFCGILLFHSAVLHLTYAFLNLRTVPK